MDKVRIDFVSTVGGGSVGLDLYSHFTCIYGKDSGEGKSFLCSLIEEGLSEGTIEVKCKLPFAVATALNIDFLLTSNKRGVILIDESSMLKGDLLRKINKSKNLFICISRSMPFKSEYPLKGLYKVVKTGNTLDIVSVDSLPLYDGDTGKDFNIVVESRKDRSEGELLGSYIPNIIPANNAGNIEKFLRGTSENILVFTDLGNIGRQYAVLMKRCKENPNIRFYDYECFEQLLYESDFVKNSVKLSKASVFDFISIEKYYEKVLERSTRRTPIWYEHGKSLKKGYLDKKNFAVVFSGNSARNIRKYIESRNWDK